MGAENAPSGLVVSPDLGKTWGRLCWPNCRAFDVAVDHSSDGRIVYIAAGNGVLKTENGGAMWRITTGWRVTEVQDVEVTSIEPSNGDFIVDTDLTVVDRAYEAVPFPEVGTTYQYIRGPLAYSFGANQIAPRDADDLSVN